MSEISLELLCIGNPLVDIFAGGNEETARRYGLESETQHISIEDLNAILKELPPPVMCSGGGAANAAKIAGLLGIDTGFVGSVGRDSFGELFEKDMKSAGVKNRLIQKDSATGACLVLRMPNGKTKIAASPGAAAELSASDISEDMIGSAKVVVLDGFMLGRESLVRRVLTLADKCGTVAALDLSAAGLAEERAHEIVTYARVYPLIIFMNEDEAKAFYMALSQSKEARRDAEEGGVLNEDLMKLFTDFTSHDIFPVIAVKLGKSGAIVFAGGNVYRERTTPVIPAETTGAGDTFCAAFLAAWIRNKSLAECAAFGNKAAKEVLKVNGVQADLKAIKHLGKHLRKKTRGVI